MNDHTKLVGGSSDGVSFYIGREAPPSINVPVARPKILPFGAEDPIANARFKYEQYRLMRIKGKSFEHLLYRIDDDADIVIHKLIRAISRKRSSRTSFRVDRCLRVAYAIQGSSLGQG